MPDDWTKIISHLNDEHFIDPIRFGDLTYPQVECLWSHGKCEDEEAQAVTRARRAAADFKAGKIKWDD